MSRPRNWSRENLLLVTLSIQLTLFDFLFLTCYKYNQKSTHRHTFLRINTRITEIIKQTAVPPKVLLVLLTVKISSDLTLNVFMSGRLKCL